MKIGGDKMKSPRTKVEVDGLEAKYYDFFMDFLTFGYYRRFINDAIRFMKIKKQDKILDLGSGTGRNACIMRKYLDDAGEIIGIDISDIMLKKSQKRCKNYKNVHFKKIRIEEEIPYENYFDKVFISFVLHGFEQEDREKILKNVAKVLKPGGEFFILDYSNAGEEEIQGIYKIFLSKIECPLAYEYVLLDQEKFLSLYGFSNFTYNYFFFKRVNLLKALKD